MALAFTAPTTLSGTGSVVVTKSTRASLAEFSISGTYTTLNFVFETSQNGTDWSPAAAILRTTGALVNGTIAPANAATLTYGVVCPNVQFVRLRVTAIASNSVTVSAVSDDTLNSPNVDPVWAVAAADGAIGITRGTVLITKTGTLAALTLAAPAVTDDGKVLTIVSTTALAHTVTNTSPGFNGGGTASDVATFTAAAGNSMELVAYNGTWWTIGLRNVTLG